ncbi:MAG: hypothetical protein LBS66_04245 [Rhodospirillaceae bacterium]|jgi:hypothetical protein|nr:hypothetical protein [Rhodospirillaceae bacterium]
MSKILSKDSESLMEVALQFNTQDILLAVATTSKNKVNVILTEIGSVFKHLAGSHNYEWEINEPQI